MKYKLFSKYINKSNLYIAILALAFFIPRLYRITEPIADMHNVRQTQTAMITRNLVEDHFNIFYTRIDWFGDKKGIVIQEFPFYQVIVAVLWKLCGEHDIYGRLVSLMFSVILCIYLYKIVSLLLNHRIAYLSILVFALCPLCIFLSRAFMINMTSLALSIISLYYYIHFLKINKLRYLLYSTLCLISAILINPPIVVPLIFVFPYLTMHYRMNYSMQNIKNQFRFYFSIIFSLLLILFTVLAWNLHLSETNAVFYPEWNANALKNHFLGIGVSRFDAINWLRIFSYLLVFVIGFHGLVLFFFGTKYILRSHSPIAGMVIAWILGAFLYYFLFFNAISFHNYYAFPITPLLCIIIGSGSYYLVEYFRKNHSSLIKYLITPLFICTLILWISIPIKHSTNIDAIAFDAGKKLNHLSKKNDLIVMAVFHSRVAPPKCYPTILYFAERKGWIMATIWNPNDFNSNSISNYKTKGAKYLLITYGSIDQSKIATFFPLFRYFSHNTFFNIGNKIELLKSQYQLVDLQNNYAIFKL